MPRTIALEDWQELMANSAPEDKDKLRQERRAGIIEITGLSRSKANVVRRAKRRDGARHGRKGR
tara:strand:+ start:4161 stop:4352 length:192 start_codon:yes stop_codon:yes gene_type:complete